jgi:hypothetical protein
MRQRVRPREHLRRGNAQVSLIVAEQFLVGTQRSEMHDNLRQRRWIGRETFAQGRHIGKLVRRQIISEDRGEFGFATAVMCECQKIDHQSAGGLFGKLFEQPIEDSPIGVTREQPVAVDQLE